MRHSRHCIVQCLASLHMLNGLKTALLLVISSATFAADVSVGFTTNREPFVNKDGSGLEVTLVRTALAHAGHTMTPIYFKGKNLKSALIVDRVDAIANMKKAQFKDYAGIAFLSDPYISFENIVVTKKGSNCKVSIPASLAKCKVAAWSSANTHLQGKWRSYFDNPAVELNKNYFEFSDQYAQVKLLLQDRVDALLIDKNIFRYQYNLMMKKSIKKLNFEFEHHDLFDSRTQIRLAFSGQKLRDDFNKGLKVLKSSGKYDALLLQYLDGVEASK